jgi:DNA-binding transcriptional ArsR family regulator
VVRASRVHLVDEPHALQALTHPVRVRVLDALRSPGSAAAAARAVGQPRQNVNYHLKELERAGLVHKVGERRNGNFIEALYQTVAPTIVVSPRATWGDPRRAEALRDQMALENLILVGERLGRDAAALLDRAAFDDEEIASAAVEADVRFANEEDRAAFMREYLAAIGPLLRKYGERNGAAYRVVLATYPHPDAEGATS